MALKLPGQWVWDSWFAFDGVDHHAFYLQASRALGDPNRRHRNVSVGHAISTDLKNWTVVADALAISESPAPDSWTTWTGSVVRQNDGTWRMFYTGTSREDAGQRQTVCAATSTDLITWTKEKNLPVVAADKRWYKTLEAGYDYEPFRDPWVFKMAGESQWTMLVTATAPKHEKFREQGVIAMAKSDDLINWRLLPPQGGDQGFGEAEVFQYEIVDGVPILLFCCGSHWLSEDRKSVDRDGGLYSIPVSKDLTNVDFTKSVRFDVDNLYASRLVKGNDGKWNLIAFINYVDGKFVGELCDPIPVTADPVLGLIKR